MIVPPFVPSLATFARASSRAVLFGLAPSPPMVFCAAPVGEVRWDAVATPWGWCARRWVGGTWVRAVWTDADPALSPPWEPEGWGFGWEAATPFQQKVWVWAMGLAGPATYGEGARAVGVPGGARAVGGALGRNPLAPLVACHWPGQSGGGLGGLGGFAWGLARKAAWRTMESSLLHKEACL